MPQIEVWLVRHAQSLFNVSDSSFSSQRVFLSDPVLTESGQEQARYFAAKIDKPFNLAIVSPLRRTVQTAQPLFDKFLCMRKEEWPIYEFNYLPPSLCETLSFEKRSAMIEEYWQRCDPTFCFSSDTESFAGFIERIAFFHHCLLNQSEKVIVFGHALFFKAYCMWLQKKISPTSESMRVFRQKEKKIVWLNLQVKTIYLSNNAKY